MLEAEKATTTLKTSENLVQAAAYRCSIKAQFSQTRAQRDEKVRHRRLIRRGWTWELLRNSAKPSRNRRLRRQMTDFLAYSVVRVLVAIIQTLPF